MLGGETRRYKETDTTRVKARAGWQNQTGHPVHPQPANNIRVSLQNIFFDLSQESEQLRLQNRTERIKKKQRKLRIKDSKSLKNSVSDLESLNPDLVENMNLDPSCFLTLPGEKKIIFKYVYADRYLTK